VIDATAERQRGRSWHIGVLMTNNDAGATEGDRRFLFDENPEK
jgi:hypothetical protein